MMLKRIQLQMQDTDAGRKSRERFDEAMKLALVENWTMNGIRHTCMGHEIIRLEWIGAFKQFVGCK